MKLSNLNLNEFGIVKDVNCCPSIKIRLLDLGIIPGTKIKPIFKSMLGDPTAYSVRGSILAIRKKDAENITIDINK